VVAWHDAFSTRGSELTDTGPYSKFAAVCASSATASGGAALAAAHNDPDLDLGSNVKSQGWAGALPPDDGGESGSDRRLSASQLLLLQTDRQILQEQVRSLQEQLREALQRLQRHGPRAAAAAERSQESEQAGQSPGATPGHGSNGRVDPRQQPTVLQHPHLDPQHPHLDPHTLTL